MTEVMGSPAHPGLQLQLMDAMLGFARARGHAVLAILHDVNQALRDFER